MDLESLIKRLSVSLERQRQRRKLLLYTYIASWHSGGHTSSSAFQRFNAVHVSFNQEQLWMKNWGWPLTAYIYQYSMNVMLVIYFCFLNPLWAQNRTTTDHYTAVR